MHTEPQIKPLSKKHRSQFFWFLVLVFLMVFPALIFYTTGYRLNLNDEEAAIVTTGGIYITTDNLEVDVYLDGQIIERPRLFRSAYYIQHIEAGIHRVVVQRPDLNTWVKDLPIDSHVVIEAAAFNMPAIPHVRPITEFVTATGTPVIFAATTTDLFDSSTSTVPVLFASKPRVNPYEVNEEFLYVESLFSTTSTSTKSVFEIFMDGVDRFRFSTTTDVGTLESSTTSTDFVELGHMRLVEKENEIYATWTNGINNIPYYFCVPSASSTDIALRYGEHVALDFEKSEKATTTPVIFDGNRKCRQEIKIDRKRQDVFFYNFFPDSRDLVLLQLEDGLYVTEIDDRSWQNTQLIYPGNDFSVELENGVIYVKDKGMFFEIITEIEPN